MNQSLPNARPQPAETVLAALAAELFTGRCTLTQTEDQTAQVWFEHGKVVAAEIPGARPRIGVRLMAAGLVRPEDLDAALRHQRDTKTPEAIGELLVAAGAVAAHEVELVAQVQLLDGMCELLRWPNVTSATFPGEVPAVPLHEPVHFTDLLAMVQHRLREMEEFSARIGGLAAVPQPSLLAAPRENIVLGPYDWAVLTRVDGQRTLGEIASQAGLTRAEVVFIITTLSEFKLVTLPTAQNLSAQPSSPQTQAAASVRRDAERNKRSNTDTATLLRELSALSRENKL